MGFFSKLFNKEERIDNDLYAKHDFEWFLGENGKKRYDSAAGSQTIETLYFDDVINSLPNIKALKEKGVRVRTHALAKCMAWLDLAEYTDKWGNKTKPVWSGFGNILDRKKNMFFDFICRLNHSITNTAMINIILTYCVNNGFMFDGEDTWLFDDPFWSNGNGDHFKEFIEKMESFPNANLSPEGIIKVVSDDDIEPKY